MSINCYALTHSNRHLFLRDLVESFADNARKDTQLIVGVQHPITREMERAISNHGTVERVIFVMFPDNIGLNRYDQLINGFTDLPEIIVDCDDDTIIPRGFEDAFEIVLSDCRFGWVGIPVLGSTPMRGGEMRQWQIQNLKVVEAAVGGGLAATRLDVYKSVGGFGVGRTIFDPEDARFQRKCLAKGYFCGIIDGMFHEHHNGWEWQIKYGTVKEKIDNLHNALLAGFIDEERFNTEMVKMAEAIGG